MTQRVSRRRLLQLAGAAAASSATASAAVDQTFWKTWSDGQAEVSSYDLTQTSPSGDVHRGVAIAIFATDTFSNALRVKADPAKHPNQDQFPVMKFELLKDLQTGLTNSHEQTSSFLALAPVNGRAAGFPTKISYSRQNWHGALYHQLLFDKTTIRSWRHGILDGDADKVQEIQYPPAATSVDALWFWARQMAEPYVKRGEFRLAPVLTSIEARGQQFKQSNFTRSPVNQKIALPSGNHDVELCSVHIDDEVRKYWVERDAPHRIVRWETSGGERGQLLGSERMKFWQLTGKGGEEQLRKLRLLPRPPRTT